MLSLRQIPWLQVCIVLLDTIMVLARLNSLTKLNKTTSVVTVIGGGGLQCTYHEHLQVHSHRWLFAAFDWLLHFVDWRLIGLSQKLSAACSTVRNAGVYAWWDREEKIETVIIFDRLFFTESLHQCQCSTKWYCLRPLRVYISRLLGGRHNCVVEAGTLWWHGRHKPALVAGGWCGGKPTEGRWSLCVGRNNSKIDHGLLIKLYLTIIKIIDDE